MGPGWRATENHPWRKASSGIGDTASPSASVACWHPQLNTLCQRKHGGYTSHISLHKSSSASSTSQRCGTHIIVVLLYSQRSMSELLQSSQSVQFPILKLPPCSASLSASYLLRGICMHNLDPKSGANCGFCYVYTFPGVGTHQGATPEPPKQCPSLCQAANFIGLNTKFILLNTKSMPYLMQHSSRLKQNSSFLVQNSPAAAAAPRLSASPSPAPPPSSASKIDQNLPTIGHSQSEIGQKPQKIAP